MVQIKHTLMSNIQAEIQAIRQELPEGVRLVAVSKYHPVGALIDAYEGGQRIFGESKVQEMTQKHETLPKDIEWHFIGHLQKNKVKYIAPYVALIHGIDSYKLLAEVDKQAEKTGRIIPCLLQIHIAQEETKFGFTPNECMDMLDDGMWRTLTHVQIAGLMGMATYTDNHEQIKQEFSTLSSLFHKLRDTHFKDEPSFCELSMGMSGDYPYALEYGATLVRVGSAIFGNRVY